MPTAANAAYYAEIVSDKSTLRALIHASTEILRDAYDESLEPREMLSRAEQKIFAILDERGAGELSNIHDILHEAMVRIDARMKHEHAIGGIETGFRDFDTLTGGLARLGADHPGRPAEHGQDGAGDEHRRARRRSSRA